MKQGILLSNPEAKKHADTHNHFGGLFAASAVVFFTAVCKGRKCSTLIWREALLPKPPK